MCRTKPWIELTSTASKRTLSDQAELRSLVAAWPDSATVSELAFGAGHSVIVFLREGSGGEGDSRRGRRQLPKGVETEDDVSERKRFYAGSATR
jgi:hypothetical protein